MLLLCKFASHSVLPLAPLCRSQVYPVGAVVGLAGGLFTYMLTRTILADPDTK